MSGNWVPEFEGQRPPFQPGNRPVNAFEPGNVPQTATHGAYSPRTVEPLAQEVVDLLLADSSVPAYAKSPAYRLELWSLARATAQAQLIEEWLVDQASDEHPIADLGDERVRSAYLLLHRAEGRAASSRSRLGLTPASAARLGKNVAQAQVAHTTDVALRMAELHAAEQRLLDQEWTPPPADGVAAGPGVGDDVAAGQPGDQDQVEEADDDADR